MSTTCPSGFATAGVFPHYTQERKEWALVAQTYDPSLLRPKDLVSTMCFASYRELCISLRFPGTEILKALRDTVFGSF